MSCGRQRLYIQGRRWAIVLLVFLTPRVGTAQSASTESIAFFEAAIRPILVEVCNECHGPDKQENNLRLDSLQGFARGGDSGPLLDHDDLASSLLISVVGYQGEIKMPEDMKLPKEDIAAMRRWVMMGAPWPKETFPAPAENPRESFASFLEESRRSHWAFRPVEKPSSPEVSRPGWVRTPVDAFTMARLDEAGLGPSPEADRRTLIRRLSFDLTGLPPGPEEVRAFVADTRPDAYERLVEKLLASPHYGERWGRHWLDVARYSDTKGYVFEEDRFFPYSYTYRDYVIRAFNEDLPYDRFIVEQLAADLMDLGEDRRPLAALGYLTLGRRFLNVADDIIDDRIDVVSRGLLGLTVGCARCHDHKFDPIQSSDYYALYGVFRSTHVPSELPLIADPDPEDAEYREFLSLLGEKERDLRDYEYEIRNDLLIEVRKELRSYLTTAQEAKAVDDDAAFKTLAKEREIRDQVLRIWVDFLKGKLETPDAVFKPYAWFDAVDTETFAETAGSVVERIRGDTSVNARIRTAFDREAPASMAEVMGRYADALEAVDGEWRDRLSAHAQMSAHTPDAPPPYPAALDDAASESLRQVIYGKDAPANIAPDAVYGISVTRIQQKVREKRRAIARHKATHEGRPDRAMVLNDSDEVFEPYIFLRGKPENVGDAVPRRFLQLLSEGEPAPFANGSGRLELARSIADPNNPLTARVFVNRVWLHHFGRPLVDTPSDFGLQSDPPTHPKLLDFLASYFVENDWSVKDLHRVIVLSSTYRQSSNALGLGATQDVENRLLWRQNRKRLDFESMRDALLVASGELDRTLGGFPRSMTKPPFTKRRAVYGLVERQNMAGFIKSFDFASPDVHSPKRFSTIVPQQSLFLMNSPFVIERARALERRTERAEDETPHARVGRLFEICFQRQPAAEELTQMVAFVSREDFDAGPPPPPPSDWRYGYGHYDADSTRVDSFTPLGIYKDRRWQPREEYPNEELGHIALHKSGGHPGHDEKHAAIRRWVAPRAGSISISGKLKRASDKGDGVIGYAVSSQGGLLGEYTVLTGEVEVDLTDIPVAAGDTIDFVVSPGATASYDSYSWSQTIRMDRPEHSEGASIRTRWESRSDFSGPAAEPPEPLSPWGQLAQVFLLTNEFMYVD